MSLKAGSATKVINCNIGDHISGQLHPRICKEIRDDLEANVLYLSDGQESVLLISCDLLWLERKVVVDVVSAIEQKTGVPTRSVIIGCTHTHDGPDTAGLLPDVAVNEEYLGNLKEWLVQAAVQAVERAKPARLGYAAGHAHIGYNRRTCWEDRTHRMYGDTRKPGFTGLEGPDDSRHTVLFAVDENNGVIGIVHNNTCHSTCLESECFASADFPGQARKYIRDAIGPDVPVLYLQGASGDISPWDLLRPERRVNGQQRMKEIGNLLAGETLRLMHKAEITDSPVLRTACEECAVDVRIPTEEQIKEAEKIVSEGVDKSNRWQYVLKSSLLRLCSEFKKKPVEMIPVHAVRIGQLAIVTNPCELYCQFGLDIKKRSPAGNTMVVQLANGGVGYCPTYYGYLGGGYSGETVYWCRLEPAAGYKIVDTSAKLLYQLWKT